MVNQNCSSRGIEITEAGHRLLLSGDQRAEDGVRSLSRGQEGCAISQPRVTRLFKLHTERDECQLRLLPILANQE